MAILAANMDIKVLIWTF